MKIDTHKLKERLGDFWFRLRAGFAFSRPIAELLLRERVLYRSPDSQERDFGLWDCQRELSNAFAICIKYGPEGQRAASALFAELYDELYKKHRQSYIKRIEELTRREYEQGREDTLRGDSL